MGDLYRIIERLSSRSYVSQLPGCGDLSVVVLQPSLYVPTYLALPVEITTQVSVLSSRLMVFHSLLMDNYICEFAN